MSVAELIEQIKALPPDELEAVRTFLLNGKPESHELPQVIYASDSDAAHAVDRVFERHGDLLRKLAE
jgi:hypothetical protein